jgi:hypothetical protein
MSPVGEIENRVSRFSFTRFALTANQAALPTSAARPTPP